MLSCLQADPPVCPARSSLDHNFSAPGIGNAFFLQFDVNPVQPGINFNTSDTSWLAVDFGTTAAGRNQFPQSTDGIGMLFRGNGATQAFDNGTNLGVGAFAPGNDDLFHHILIQIVDPLDGNPFNGSASAISILAFADGSAFPFFSYVRPNNFTSNYVSFVGEGEGSGGDGVVRHALTNVIVSVDSVPEPSTFVLSISGAFCLFQCRLSIHRFSSTASGVIDNRIMTEF